MTILPFFPKSDFLETKWWHRLFVVLSTAFLVVITGITIFFFQLVFKTSYENTTFVEIRNKKTQETKHVTLSSLWNYNLSIDDVKSKTKTTEWGTFAEEFMDVVSIPYIILAVLLGVFGGNIVYRIFLYIVIGNWKKVEEKNSKKD